MSILIKGGKIIDPASQCEDFLDVFISGEKIKKLQKNLKMKEAEIIIDAREKIIIPGLVDMHTHVRQPGREDEETIKSASLAAARGGFTTICCMPNTTPPIDNPALVRFIHEEVRRNSLIEILPVGAITQNLEGKKISEMGRLKKAGVIGFSDDGKWVVNSQIMRRALEYAKMLDIPLISHCEDPSLSEGGVMNEGYWSCVLGFPGIPGEAEEIAVARDLALCRLTGCRLHIAHVSTRESVQLIREAKKRNLKISCEVTPHHLALSDEEVKTFDTNTKVNPPLRSHEDIEALKQGLKENIIDVIATDHAPHSPEEKELEYPNAPFGVIGLETALSVVLKTLVQSGVLTLKEAIAKLSLNPARILGIDRGSIQEGKTANLVIVNLKENWEVREEDFLSLSKNSPFIGWTLPGKVEYTICRGKIVYKGE